MTEKKSETKTTHGFSSILQHEFRPVEDNDQKVRMTENVDLQGVDIDVYDDRTGEWTRISLAGEDIDQVVAFAHAVRAKYT